MVQGVDQMLFRLMFVTAKDDAGAQQLLQPFAGALVQLLAADKIYEAQYQGKKYYAVKKP